MRTRRTHPPSGLRALARAAGVYDSHDRNEDDEGRVGRPVARRPVAGL